MTIRFIQIHWLTSYPSALLNRDDAGFAKRIPFGGVVRTRISSQCMKRHWRVFHGLNSLNEISIPSSVRSRLTFEKYVAAPLIQEGLNPDMVRQVTTALIDHILGKSKKQKGRSDQSDSESTQKSELIATSQVTVFGHPEIDYFKEKVRQACQGAPDIKVALNNFNNLIDKLTRENLKQLKHSAGLDASLFGRMVTSDILARMDAAIHVAHAFTVHAEASESDYFSAMDDLLTGDNAKQESGHINSTELTSGLYYGYAVVDVPLLISNLEGCSQFDAIQADKTLAANVVEKLIHMIATVSPGAKLGSTAPYAYANMVLVESGESQPRTLANAFIEPVTERPNLLKNTYKSMEDFLNDFVQMHGYRNACCIAGMGHMEGILSALNITDKKSLAELSQWAGQQIRG